MQVYLTDPAIFDLEEIEQFISQDNSAAALRLIERLQLRCLLLGDFPHIGRKRDYIRPNLRTVTEGNYVICYRLRNDAVEILRILNGARDIDEILKLLDAETT